MQSERHVGELDGVRALAIWMVLLGHLFFGEATRPTMSRVLPGALSVVGGHLGRGVDLFFVLSGLLITRILLDAKHAAGYFSTFYSRRALRILPLYVVVIVVSVIAYGPTFRDYYWLAVFFSANFAHTLHVTGPNGMGPMWSLAVEEQFYLVWPLVVFFTNRRALGAIAGAMLLIEPTLRFASGAHGDILPVTTWCRSDGLALGSLLALWTTSPRANVARSARVVSALVAAAAAIGFAEVCVRNTKIAAAAGVALRVSQFDLLFAALVLIAVTYAGHGRLAPLRSRFARVSADYSFCLYLVHVPLIDAYASLVRLVPPLAEAVATTPAEIVARAAIVLPAAFALAAASRHYLERPFLRMRRFLGPARVALPAASVAD